MAASYFLLENELALPSILENSCNTEYSQSFSRLDAYQIALNPQTDSLKKIEFVESHRRNSSFVCPNFFCYRMPAYSFNKQKLCW